MEVMRAVGGKKLLVYRSVLLSVVFWVLQLSHNIYADSLPEQGTVTSVYSKECNGIFSEIHSGIEDISIDESRATLEHKLADRVLTLTSKSSSGTVKSILEGVYLKEKFLMIPVNTVRHQFKP